MKHLKRKVAIHYGDDIVITSITGKSSIVSFCHMAFRILHEELKTDKALDKKSQSDRIIYMGASIILIDIRLMVYGCERYETLKTIQNEESLIPDSLKCFLHKVVDGEG